MVSENDKAIRSLRHTIRLTTIKFSDMIANSDIDQHYFENLHKKNGVFSVMRKIVQKISR